MTNFSRDLVRENTLSIQDLIYPIFIIEGTNKKIPIDSMPDTFKFSADNWGLQEELDSNLSCILYVEFDPQVHESTAFYQPFPDPWFGTLHKIQPQIEEGDILMFPSCFLYPHQVEEVITGKRYTFVSWGV